MRERLKDIATVLLIIVFFVIFFWRGIFGGEFFLISDPHFAFHPMRSVGWEMIRQGALPLWTPLIFSGYPLLSMAQLGFAYPLTWGYLILPGPWAEQAYLLSPYLFAPIFTYAYARAVGRSRLASLLAGLSFGYGGMMASWIANGVHTNTSMWLPLMLIPIWRSRTDRFITCLLGAAIAYSLTVFAGSGQFFTLVGVVALAYAVFLCAASFFPGGSVSGGSWLAWQRWKPLAVALGGIVMAACVAAFQILETWKALRLSIRNHLSYELFSQLYYSPTKAWRAFLAPIYNYAETTPFVLPLVALLALVAVVAAIRHPRRDPQVIFWLIVAVVAALLILGPHTPLHRAIYHIPILNSFRGPSRHTFELTFALGMLGAYGWDAVSEMTKSRMRTGRNKNLMLIASAVILVVSVVVGARWILATPKPVADGSVDLHRAETNYLFWKAAFCLLTLLAIWLFSRITAGRARTGLLTAMVLVIAFTEPYIICSRWWAFAGLPESRLTHISPVSRWLQKQAPEQNRVYTRVRLFAERYATSPALDAPNITALAGLHNLAGYEPLISRRYSRALGDVWLDGVTPLSGSSPDDSLLEPQSHVLDLLNARFVVAFSNLAVDRDGAIEKPGISFDQQQTDRWKLAYQENGAIVIENRRAAPRAWLVAEAESVDEEEALRRIRGESPRSFDPRQTALLEIEPGAMPQLPGGAISASASAEVVSYEANRLEIETRADHPTVLVVSEINYPGWKARVDGAEAPIYQTDYLLRGVPLPAGSHRVEMSYAPLTARVGAGISVAALSAILVLAGYARHTRKKKRCCRQPTGIFRNKLRSHIK